MVIDDGSGIAAYASATLGGNAINGAGAPIASPGASVAAEALLRYQTIRGNVEHEDQLMGTRVGWLIASEAFLFVAYANVGRPDTEGKAENLRSVLPVLGVAIALLVFGAMVAAVRAIRELDRQARELDRKERELDHQARDLFPIGLPPVVGKPGTHRLGLYTTLTLPVVLIVAWACTLLA
jgi:hypothetical protein